MVAPCFAFSDDVNKLLLYSTSLKGTHLSSHLQVKILLETPVPGGKPKSRGRGFIEFTEHEHALCALRQLNNNPTTFGAGLDEQHLLSVL